MRLSKKRAYYLCYKLWAWLADHSEAEKYDWPGWLSNGGEINAVYVLHYCFACEYNNQDCAHCIMSECWGYTGCCNYGSPYGIWKRTIHNSERVEAALEIADYAYLKYVELGGERV